MLSSTRNAPSQLGKASLSIPRAEHAKLWTLMIQQGNSIGKTRPPLLASAANIEVDPITVTGTIGPERRMGFADASDRTDKQSGSGSSGGGSSGGASSGGSD